LEALAAELGLPAKAALELYRRLKKVVAPEEAAAVALFVTSKRSGSYVSLARVCELLAKCGLKVSYPRAVRATLACGALIRPTLEEALEVYARKLGLSEARFIFSCFNVCTYAKSLWNFILAMVSTSSSPQRNPATRKTSPLGLSSI
jgi:hypothetical protein